MAIHGNHSQLKICLDLELKVIEGEILSLVLESWNKLELNCVQVPTCSELSAKFPVLLH